MATTPVRRKLATALTLLYLVLVGVVPLAHADAEGASGVAHVVAWGEDACPPLHHEAHCPACKAGGGSLAAPTAPGAWLLLADGHADVLRLRRIVDLPPPPVSVPPSRAPPLA